MKKAFDTIDHSLLLKKIENYGIRGKALTWVKSYLNNRQQYVYFNDTKSDILNISCGVPQGSILGPKFFILYLNDITQVSKLLKFIIFADDTNVLYSHKDTKMLTNIINNELKKLEVWFSVNKLSLNVLKTNYMLFSKCKKTENMEIYMNNSGISRVKVTKFLGVIIDENLNWKEHIKLVSSKISKNIAIIYKAKQFFENSFVLRTLYCSLILSYLMYCMEIWGNTYKYNLKGIVLLQKRAIRIISGANRLAHTNKLFYDLKLLKLNDMVEYQTLIIMYRAFNNNLSKNIQDMFVLNTDVNYSVRQKNNFKTKYVRTTLKSMSVSSRGVKLWNKLDKKLAYTPDILTFKKCFKKGFLEEYLLTS